MTIATEQDLIPVLDLSPLLEPTPSSASIESLGAELRTALEHVGFFFITMIVFDLLLIRGTVSLR